MIEPRIFKVHVRARKNAQFLPEKILFQFMEVRRRLPFRFKRLEQSCDLSREAIHISSRSSLHSSGNSGEQDGPRTPAVASEVSSPVLLALTVSNRKGEILEFAEPFSGVYLYNLTDCIVHLSAVKGSVQVANCVDTVVSGFCSQLRITDSSGLTLYFQTNSSTALVNSQNISIGRPPLILERIAYDTALRLTGLDSEEYVNSSKWRNVSDFDNLTAKSPNWNFISDK